ncbi:MAG: hypothetical protein BWX44_01534 [Spirochaetes bacterium ADurb.Bin001]|nr:MAG: hypothetical protein BWX44_01534 [Spirochaetes bacterium ADurb.Bin001]
MISSTSQQSDCFEFGCRSVPPNVVHACGAFALIFRHPFYSQGFAAERVGQQPLQGFHLAPATFPCGLHDTGLQPSDLVSTLVPVDLLPVLGRAGGCTRGRVHVHLRFPPREGSACVLVTRNLLEVCPLSRRGDLTAPIRSITERLSLGPAILCPALQQPVLRCGLPPGRRSSGFTVFRSRNMDDLAPAFTPAILGVRVPR